MKTLKVIRTMSHMPLDSNKPVLYEAGRTYEVQDYVVKSATEQGWGHELIAPAPAPAPASPAPASQDSKQSESDGKAEEPSSSEPDPASKTEPTSTISARGGKKGK